MTLFFLISIVICGVFDARYREVPLWGMCLAGIGAVGMCVNHPVFSVLTGIAALCLCLACKMGTADKVLFPIAAAAIGQFGMVCIGIAIAGATWHGRRKAAPAVLYLAITCVISLWLLGGR